jgi:manganese/zinc/iron transport system permease protein
MNLPFKELLEFFTFSEPNVQVVFWGVLVLSSVSALVGCFTYLRKRSLIGDVIAHSVLPGIALAFLLSREKDPFQLLIGAGITGWLSVYLVDFITHHSKIKNDTAIALILSVFFGAGVLLLTHIQHTGLASQSGLDSFIFGKAAAMRPQEVKLFLIIGIIVTIATIVFLRGFYVMAFDEDFAIAIGFPVPWLRVILSIITVLIVASGVQAVGVVLMSALLITPAAAARFWTNKLKFLIWIAVCFGAVSGVLGAAISYSYNGMPTGPWIVIVLSLLAFFSALFAPQKGIYARWSHNRFNSRKILCENILKRFFHLEQHHPEKRDYSLVEILSKLNLKEAELKSGLRLLVRNDKLTRTGMNWTLEEVGRTEAREIVRKHRLWELYLSKYLNIKEDHVHDDAEGIEHVITPEILKELEVLLKHPETDPHNREIPY